MFTLRQRDTCGSGNVEHSHLHTAPCDLIRNGPAGIDGGVAVLRPKTLLQQVVLEVVAGQGLGLGGPGQEEEEQEEHDYC